MSIAITDHCKQCGAYWHVTSYSRAKYESEGFLCPSCELKEEWAQAAKRKLKEKKIDSRFEILDL